MSPSEKRIQIVEVDYHNVRHAQALVAVLDQYARDPMGGGQGLRPEVKACLVDKLAELPHAVSLLAFDGEVAVGLINAFQCFSTFAAAPVMNIHDVMVLASHRGNGIAARMLAATETMAVSRGCCRLTLEVLEGNHGAQSVYGRCGFIDPQGYPGLGRTWFLEKSLR